MKVGITGATGFIARHLIPALRAHGHDPVAFARSPGQPVAGCAETRLLAPAAPPDVTGLDAVINLAGESIIGLWTAAKRQRITASRVGTTRRLVAALRDTPGAPKVLLNASAIGFYGDGGQRELTEDSPVGTGFLPEVCREWETEAREAHASGVRVALVRIGYVVGGDGGAFPPVRATFKLGLGGRVGDGQQWMPPVHVADVAGLFVHLLETPAAVGPYNAVCPHPVRNADFTRAVAHALHRPAIFPAPAFLLRAAMGDLSHLLLDSARVLPERTLASGYIFHFPALAEMLADVCRSRGRSEA